MNPKVQDGEESWDRILRAVAAKQPEALFGRDDDAAALMLLSFSVIRDAMDRGGQSMSMVRNLYVDCYLNMAKHGVADVDEVVQ